MERSRTYSEIGLTADVVASNISFNSVPSSDLPELIHSVHSALTKLGSAPAESEPEAQAPAVPVRKLVTSDFLICLDDGKKFKSLRRHLAGLGMT